MSESSKNKILQSIAAVRTKRAAAMLVNDLHQEEIYRTIEPDAITCFKNELEAINGQCILCSDQNDLIVKLNDLLIQKGIEELHCIDPALTRQLPKTKLTSDPDKFETMKAGLTSCEFLIARTGSILISSANPSGRQMYAFPPIHFVVAESKQLVNYPEDAYKAIQKKYNHQLPSAITTITGPSRTADIEKTLVLGAHGPKELIVLLIVN